MKPTPELASRIAGAKNRRRHADHARSRRQNLRSCLQRHSAHRNKHHIRPRLLAQSADPRSTDRRFCCLFGCRGKNRPDRQIVRWLIQNSRHQRFTPAECAHNSCPAPAVAALRRGVASPASTCTPSNPARSTRSTRSSRISLMFGPGSAARRIAASASNFGFASCFVPVLEQRHAGLGQLARLAAAKTPPAQPAESFPHQESDRP